jgi:hypothetical protein
MSTSKIPVKMLTSRLPTVKMSTSKIPMSKCQHPKYHPSKCQHPNCIHKNVDITMPQLHCFKNRPLELTYLGPRVQQKFPLLGS